MESIENNLDGENLVGIYLSNEMLPVAWAQAPCNNYV